MRIPFPYNGNRLISILSHLFVEQNIGLVVQNLLCPYSSHRRIIEPKPLIVFSSSIRGVVAFRGIPSVVSNRCHKLIFQTLQEETSVNSNNSKEDNKVFVFKFNTLLDGEARR